MKIVAGLGNPGPEYETTRHNVGFIAVDRLIDEWKARGPSRKFDGEIFEAEVAGEKVLLVKPQTYMNLSGKCIASLMKFYKLAPTELLVIHDELDLRPLRIQVKTGGGSAGNNGIRSIDAEMGSGATGYHRIRVGVGKPAELGLRMSGADYVLQQFSDSELEALDKILDRVAAAAERVVRGDVTGAMNEFNTDLRE